MESLGVKGDTYYIIDKNSGTAYSFNRFGDMVSEMDSRTAEIRLCNGYKTDVSMLSILGELTKPYSEIYYNGYVAEVNQNYINVFSSLNDVLPKVNHLIFRIQRPKHVCQILLPTNKDYVTHKSIDEIIPNLEWVKVSC